MKKVLVYYQLSQGARDSLEQAGLSPLVTGTDVPWLADGWKHLQDMDPAALAQCEILIGNAMAVNAALLERMPALRWVHSPMAGLSGSMDWALFDAHGIAVTPSHVHADMISEMIVGMMLGLTKRFPFYTECKQAHRYQPSGAGVMHGATALIAGVGTIGAAAARILHDGFGMHVIGLNSDGRPVDGCDETASLAALRDHLPLADYVALCLPLTEATKGCIGKAELALMKPTAYLVNIARGGLIDQSALVDALYAGRLAGAGLDVFEKEPLPEDDPLWDAPNVILTPHVAGNCEDYGDRVIRMFLRNLPAYRAGRPADMPDYANIKRY